MKKGMIFLTVVVVLNMVGISSAAVGDVDVDVGVIYRDVSLSSKNRCGYQKQSNQEKQEFFHAFSPCSKTTI